MNKIKKLISVMFVVLLLTVSLVIPASAYSYEVRDNGGGSIRGYQNGSETTYTATVSYASKWQHTATVDGGKGKIKYGFDTYLLNEDYCSTYHSTQSHQATVKHSGDKDDDGAAWAKAGKWTETVFVKHNAKPIWRLIY